MGAGLAVWLTSLALPCSLLACLGLLLGASEETQDDSSAGPVIVLMGVRAERGPVVVDIEEADFPATGGAVVDAATYFKGDAVLRRSGAAADGGVCARAADEAFGEGSDVPAVLPTVEVARAVVISIEDGFGPADSDEAVAAVADDLQPGFYIVAKGAERSVEIGGGVTAAVVHASERKAAVEFDEWCGANAGERFLPGLARVGRADGAWCWFGWRRVGLSGGLWCGCDGLRRRRRCRRIRLCDCRRGTGLGSGRRGFWRI
jgi:hypothetical protein